MKRYMIFFVLILLQAPVIASSLYPFDKPEQDAQFMQLLRELRCLVCQNQDLADSNASLANDLRLDVYLLVKQGKSHDDIVDYLVKRYGDFILFNPALTIKTIVLWFGPVVFVLFGMVIVWRMSVK